MKTIGPNISTRKDFLKAILEELTAPSIYIIDDCLFFSLLPVSVEELSKAIKKPESFIVNFFWQRQKKISRQQNLSKELLEEFCSANGLKTKEKEKNFNEIIKDYFDSVLFDQKDLNFRSPVVVIMGHVNHGKTTLIETLCQTNIVEKEIGEITQKVSIFPVEFEEKTFLLLDTPGHNDFTRLRHRGTFLAELVVLVVDAKEGIKDQTEEIIEYIKSFSLGFLVFLNYRKDYWSREEGVNIFNQLQSKGITPLERGGNAIVISGNAKKRDSLNDLMENISLLTEGCFASYNEELTFGVVIDSFFSFKMKLIVNRLLIQSGKLKEGNYIFISGKICHLKSMFNLKNEKINFANPGDVVLVSGANFFVEIGEKFFLLKKEEKDRLELNNIRSETKKIAFFVENKEKKTNVNFFLVADSKNSLQILTDLVSKNNKTEVGLSIVGASVGRLKYSELELIKATKSTILSFGVDLDSFASNFIKDNLIKIISSPVIYRLDEGIQQIVLEESGTKKLVEKKTGEARIKIVYEFSKGNIAGCQITSGLVERSNQIHLFRNGKKIFTGRIKSLEIEKTPKREVRFGQECGIVLEKFNDYKIDDKIVSFCLVEEKQI